MLKRTVSIRVHANVFGIIFLAVAAHARAELGAATDKPTEEATAAGVVSCNEFVGLDFNQDCDVDLDDYRHFQVCVTGSDMGPPAAGCEAMDRDGDGDVDQTDGALFAQCRSGPGVVADSACEDPDYEPPTGLAKIDEELAAGKITELEALRYSVFNIFGDGRLPSRFYGATFEEGTHVMAALEQQYSDLPTEAQDELRPFLLAPDAVGSWYQLSLGASSAMSAAGGQPSGEFIGLDVFDGSGHNVAVVHYPVGSSQAVIDSAETVRAALAGTNGVYAKLTALMGRTPPSDADVWFNNNGGDGRYDIYLMPQGSSVYGKTCQHNGDVSQFLTFDSTRPSYIIMDTTTIGNNFSGAAYNKKLRANIAHEFMHAIQNAFDLGVVFRSESKWLGDATATWAEHYVFPNDHMEHDDAPFFLKTLDKSLEIDLPNSDANANRRYGGYLYFFHHVNKYSADILRFTYESAEIVDTVEAIDRAVPGGIADNWAEFAVANWNDPPVDDYETDDTLKKGAKNYTDHETPTLTGSQEELELTLKGDGLEPLSAQYFHFILSDSSIRTVMFANGITFDLDRGVPPVFQGALGDETFFATHLSQTDKERLHVLALIKQNGAWNPDPINLTNVAFATFCQEASSESAEEIVIIMANARFEADERDPVQQPRLTSRLFISNMGCGAWEGTASSNVDISEPDEQTLSNADWQTIEFTRNTLTLDQIASGAGQISFGPPTAGTTVIPAGIMLGLTSPGMEYRLATVTATWGHISNYEVGLSSCTELGSGTLQTSDAFPGQFFIAPYLTASLGTEVASIYRSYFIEQFFVDADENSARTCVDSQGNVTNSEVPFGAGIGGGFRNSELGSFTISASGNQIIKTFKVDDTTIQYNLHSQNIP